jgi:hypothetical protein
MNKLINTLNTMSDIIKRVLIVVAAIVSTILVFQDGSSSWKDWTLIIWILCITKGMDMFDEFCENRND